MRRTNYFQQVVDESRDEHCGFAGHVALLFQGDGKAFDWRIRWARPGSSNFWVDYLSCGGALFVRGDLGAATYVWNDRHISPQFVANCAFDYFHSKCEASEDGSRPKQWEKSAALAWLHEVRVGLRELVQEDYLDTGQARERFALLRSLRGVADCVDEFRDFIRNNDNEFYSAGFDSDDLSTLYDAGMVPAARCILHWLGIKAAVAALAAAASSAATDVQAVGA